MKAQRIGIQTDGEEFYEITAQVKDSLQDLLSENHKKDANGVLIIYCIHTSCALCINEAHEDSAKKDMSSFLKQLAPQNLPFIEHTTEGPDDSPSHMKSILLQPYLHLIVEEGQIVLGRWQGVFLAEFRASKRKRELILKFQADTE